jgi:hypothetical protein
MEGERGAERRAALIVATWEYEDGRFGELRSPSHDADRLAQLLGDVELGGFDVEVLRNQGVLKVKRRIETFLRERARNDLTLLYFSGHGVLDERNRYFIAAVDTDMDALASTGIDRDFVNARIEDCRSRRVLLLLDTCHSGAFGKDAGFKAATAPPRVGAGFGGEGRVVISASGPLEYAFESDQGSGDPSVFTAALVRGLETGEADRDRNDMVTVDELYDYLCTEVSGQQPTKSGHVSGELVVAQVPVSRRRPAPLPAELQRAIDSDDRFTRLGAIVRLEHMLQGDDAGLAAAARLGLVALTDDDSRQVSDAAAAALARMPEAAPPLPPPPPPVEPEPVDTPPIETPAGAVASAPCILEQHLGGHVNAVAFSSDGSFVAAGTSKPSLLIVDVRSGSRVLDRGGMANVNDVAWSPGDVSLAFTTGGKSRLLRRKERLDPTTLSEALDVVLAHGWSVTLHGIDHPSDDVVVTAGQGTTWWSGQQKVRQVDVQLTTYAVAVDPRGKSLVASASSDGQIRLHRMPEGELVRAFSHDASVRSVAFSPDGVLLASGSDDRTWRLWEVATGRELHREARGDFVRAVAFDGTGRVLATGDDTAEAVVWDVASRQPVAVCTHQDWVYGVALSPDGGLLATGCRDKHFRVFSLA